MRLSLFIIALTVFSGFQGKDLTQDLKEAKIKFDLVGRIWFSADKRKQGDRTIYYYKRMPLQDEKKIQVFPSMSIVIEPLGKEISIDDYAKSKWSQSNVEVLEEYATDSGKIGFKDAVGYKYKYIDHFKSEHTAIVVYGVNGKVGFQFVCDVLSDHFDKVEEEYLRTIKTIRKR